MGTCSRRKPSVLGCLAARHESPRTQRRCGALFTRQTLHQVRLEYSVHRDVRVSHTHASSTTHTEEVGCRRRVLLATEDHIAEMKQNGEEVECLSRCAASFVPAYQEAVVRAATKYGIPMGPITEVEVIRTDSKSQGQAVHMDSLQVRARLCMRAFA